MLQGEYYCPHCETQFRFDNIPGHFNYDRDPSLCGCQNENDEPGKPIAWPHKYVIYVCMTCDATWLIDDISEWHNQYCHYTDQERYAYAAQATDQLPDSWRGTEWTD